jgi:hypothetical protein
MTASSILRAIQTADRRKDRGARPHYTGAQANPAAHIPHDRGDVSLDELWELYSRECPTPQATIEALMLGLRERGVAALNEPDTQRRLADLSKGQLVEVATRLQKLKPEIAQAWTDNEIKTLIRFRKGLC